MVRVSMILRREILSKGKAAKARRDLGKNVMIALAVEDLEVHPRCADVKMMTIQRTDSDTIHMIVVVMKDKIDLIIKDMVVTVSSS